MNCEQWFEKLYSYIDKDCDQIVWKDVEDHMHHCRPCCDRYELEVRIKERMQKTCKFEKCTESLRIRIQAILKSI